MGFISIPRIRYIMEQRFKPRLQMNQNIAFVLNIDGSGLFYHSSINGEVIPIAKFSNEDELDILLEDLQRNKTEYRDGKIQTKRNDPVKQGRQRQKITDFTERDNPRPGDNLSALFD